MNGACLPLPTSGTDPTTALTNGLELVARGTDQLRAAMEVEWEAPAARLYRAAVGDAAHAVARDLDLLEAAIRHAAEYRAAGGPP